MTRLALLKRRVATVAVGALALAGAIACQGDEGLSPGEDLASGAQTSTASLGEKLAASGDSTLQVPTLARNVALAQDMTVSGVIGKEGGYIGIPEAGAWLYVPQGVLSENVVFSITAKAGSAIAYDFGPAGSAFRDAVVIVQELPQTNWTSLPDPLAIEGGYFASDTQLDTKRNSANVSEFVYTQVDLKHSRALVYVNHFSGYVIATGGQ